LSKTTGVSQGYVEDFAIEGRANMA